MLASRMAQFGVLVQAGKKEPHSGVALGDHGEDRSSRGPAFWTSHAVIHFAWRVKWPKVKMGTDPRAGVRSSLQTSRTTRAVGKRGGMHAGGLPTTRNQVPQKRPQMIRWMGRQQLPTSARVLSVPS